jgi:gluconolactonase
VRISSFSSIPSTSEAPLHIFLLPNTHQIPNSYKYTLDPTTQSFTNRRVFAYVDNGVADGIQLDTKGNVYAGCGDGVQIWDPTGTLIGKIFLGTTSANMAFTGEGTMVVLAERELYFVQFDEGVRGVVEGKWGK